MRAVFLEGRNIFLAPLSKKCRLEGYVNWLNDQETTLFMGSGRFPVNIERIKEVSII